MYSAYAASREDLRLEARDTLQRIFTRGTLGSRIRDARKILCREPFRWTSNRVFDVFNGKARTVQGHEIDHVRALKRLRDLEEAVHELESIDEVRTQLARLKTALVVSDEDFHGPQIEALRDAISRARGELPRAGGLVAPGRKGDAE